jgi:hypothetical protein
MKLRWLLLVISSLFLSSVSAATFESITTYAGRLTESGAPANGTVPMVFTLYDAANGGTSVSSSIPFDVPVSNGLFSVDLDFGGPVYNGDARWLQIEINGTLLAPRQRVSPTAYAVYAATANTLPGGAVTSSLLAVNAVGSSNLAAGAVTSSRIADGQVVRSLNGYFDNVALSAGVNIAINPTGNGLEISAPGGSSGWGLAGNSTLAGNFLGTTNNQPLEVRVKNLTALRLIPGTDQPNLSGGPNIVAGAGINTVAGDLQGATISGGGLISLFGTPYPNRILSGSLYATIGGGLGNTIGTNSGEATIAGGNQNTVYSNSMRSVIGGGIQNFIGTNCNSSTIAGGDHNSCGSNSAFVGGGTGNHANGSSSTLAGGYDNKVNSDVTFIGGGARNRCSGNFASIAGGENNITSADYATIAGGSANQVAGVGAGTVGGGVGNVASGDSSTIPGGSSNVAQGRNSFAAGRAAHALHNGSFVWADEQGTVPSPTPFESTITNQFSVRASGGINFQAGDVSINDRDLRLRAGNDPYHGLGRYGPAKLFGSSDLDGPVLYGYGGGTLGSKQYGERRHLAWYSDGSMYVHMGGNGFFIDDVINGGSGGTLSFSPAPGDFIYATGGARLTRAGVWQNSCDRSRKTDFESIDPKEVLTKLASLAVRSWRYTNEAITIRHLGPTAQDFKATFGLGDSDKSIGTVDADGVALAAIQGLYLIVQQQDDDLRALRAQSKQNAELKQELDSLKGTLVTQGETLARWESRFANLEEKIEHVQIRRSSLTAASVVGD